MSVQSVNDQWTEDARDQITYWLSYSKTLPNVPSQETIEWLRGPSSETMNYNE